MYRLYEMKLVEYKISFGEQVILWLKSFNILKQRQTWRKEVSQKNLVYKVNSLSKSCATYKIPFGNYQLDK